MVDCESFLSNMVSVIQVKSLDNITALLAQTTELAWASAKQMMPQRVDPLSRLALLAQGLQGTAPVAPVPGVCRNTFGKSHVQIFDAWQERIL
jgi:hypothetical protein